MKITNEWLRNHEACTSGYEWSLKQEERELKPFLDALVKSEHWNWANWVIVRCMNKRQKVQYAIFAAEQVINIYEKKYQDDKRPREAIDAAKAYLANPCAKTKAAAAAYAAASAAYAAYAAYAAAASAAYADYAYADAAYAAAAYAAYAYADAAYAAAAAARNKMRKTILDYGIQLVEGAI